MNIQGSLNNLMNTTAMAYRGVKLFNEKKAKEAQAKAEKELAAKRRQTAKARAAKAAKRKRYVDALYNAGLNPQRNRAAFESAMKQGGYRLGKND